MSKIICDVCGTSYPETAAQCPICGCVRPGEAQSVLGDTNEDNMGYTYVKGGRFSKSNVRKRNKLAGYESTPVQPSADDDSEKKENKGLIITAIVLLLAIIAVVIYIIARFFLPGSSGNKDTTGGTESKQPSTSATTALTIPCENLKLDVAAITFDKLDAARMLYAKPEPADTTDKIVFSSSDETVVTVNSDGKVIAVGPGQATITVTCGDVKTECTVTCAFEIPTESTPPTEPSQGPTEPTEEFRLNREDITFSRKGDSWMIYSGSLGLTKITWTSDDETIATIKNGKVVAVGKGTTMVHAEYNGQTASCIIRCAFSDSSDSNTGSGGNVTEDGGTATVAKYQLKNMVGGPTDDVTINVDYSFDMRLVDTNGNAVSGATWTVLDSSVCSVVNGTVTGVGPGKTMVTVSFDGETYSFIVHVN